MTKRSKIPKKKNSIQEQRLKAEEDFNNKTKQKEDRKAAIEQANKTVDPSHNVSVPNYIFDEQLRVYREVEPPSKEIFKKVGFNDQQKIKEIMALMNKIPSSVAN